jgi:hypothetical protein
MDKLEELKKLKKMLDDGLLTQHEYNSLKDEIIVGDTQKEHKTKENPVESTQASAQTSNESKNYEELKDVYDSQLPKGNGTFNKYAKTILFVSLGILVLVALLYDKGLINFNRVSGKKEYDTDNIKNLEDLKGYVSQRAESTCKEFHEIIKYKNEEKKHKKWYYLDEDVLNFEFTIIPLVVQNNDLPDDYAKQVRVMFDDQLKACGYHEYGSEPVPNSDNKSSNSDNQNQSLNQSSQSEDDSNVVTKAMGTVYLNTTKMEGAIGNNKIVMELSVPYGGASNCIFIGNYYYVKYNNPIHLCSVDGEKIMESVNGKETGYFIIKDWDKKIGETTNGKWYTIDGYKSYPVSLTIIAK